MEAKIAPAWAAMVLLIAFEHGCSAGPCASLEALKCEYHLHTELEYSEELSAHFFCDVMLALKNCLLNNAKCNQTSTEESMAHVKGGMGIDCRGMGDPKTEIANGCRQPEYSRCIHDSKSAKSQASKERKMAKDYSCPVALDTGECLKARAGCNKVFAGYRVELVEKHFGITCSAPAAPPSAAATISAALLLLLLPLRALRLLP